MRNHGIVRAISVAVAVILVVSVTAPLVARVTDIPETVIVTVRPKPGAESDLERVMANHWSTAQRLGLVLAEPHVRIRANDANGKPYLVEILTWRDEDIPDNAPPEILGIWADMNRLVETRNGHPGLEIVRGTLVSSEGLRPSDSPCTRSLARTLPQQTSPLAASRFVR